MSNILKGTAEEFSADKLFANSCFSLKSYVIFFLKCFNLESTMNQSHTLQIILGNKVIFLSEYFIILTGFSDKLINT